MTSPPGATRAGFGCDLSVDEFLLITDADWEPVALVSGDCTFNPGRQASTRARSKELNWISDAHTTGQARALERMKSQAAEAGGQGIVGVRLDIADIEVGEAATTLHHYSAVGTAIRRREHHAVPKAGPFTSHLSGQDTWALMTAGVTPLALVFGYSAYHSKTTYRRLRECCEMTEITDAVYSARELAMSRMRSQAARLKASGIVGVDVEMRFAPPHTITFTALGTAITRSPPELPTPPTVAVDVTNRRPQPALSRPE